LVASRHPRGGAWSPPEQISDGINGHCATSADEQGVVTLAWFRRDPATLKTNVRATRLVGEAWEPAVDVTSTGDQVMGQLFVAVDATGGATITLYRQLGQLQTVSRLSSGGWTAPVDVPGVTSGWSLEDISANADGDLAATWWDARDGASVGGVHVARRPAGGTWSAPVKVSTRATYGAATALDSSGRVTVVWTRRLRTGPSYTNVVQSMLLPALAPEVRAMRVSEKSSGRTAPTPSAPLGRASSSASRRTPGSPCAGVAWVPNTRRCRSQGGSMPGPRASGSVPAPASTPSGRVTTC
jgi:hypothetical protein